MGYFNSLKLTKGLTKSLIKSVLTVSVLLSLVLVSSCGKDAADDKNTTEDSSSSTATTEQPDSTSPDSTTPDSTTMETSPSTADSTMADSGSGDNSDPAVTTENTSSNAGSGDNGAQNEGLDLARKSGCLVCHSVEKKLVGPAWKDVSARYKGDASARSKLIEKVKKGGSGNWTDVVGNVAMPPYFPRVSEENIEKLVDFVLSIESSS